MRAGTNFLEARMSRATPGLLKVRLVTNSGHLYNSSDRWNSVVVYDEQSIPAWRSKVCIRRSTHRESSRGFLKRERLETLSIIKPVSRGRQTNQRDRSDVRRVWCIHDEIRAVRNLRRHGSD